MASADTRQLVTPGGHLEPGHEGWASGILDSKNVGLQVSSTVGLAVLEQNLAT